MMQERYLSEESFLSAEMIAEWKKGRSVYNFRTLPQKAIIVLHQSAFPKNVLLFAKKIKGLNGINFVSKSYVYCSGFGNGGPALIALMEELRALGIREFIFVGLCGTVIREIASGDAFYVNAAHSGSGTVPFYSQNNPVLPFDLPYIKKISDTIGLRSIDCFSTDSPFRLTNSLYTEIVGKGCGVIEMECASVYAFSQFYRLKSICLVVAADKFAGGWEPPHDMQLLRNVQRKLIYSIVKEAL